MMGMPLQRELAYTRDRIDHNFSNYSAWHHRSRLLPAACAAAEGEEGAAPGASQHSALPLRMLQGEYELVKQAFFTEPLDQSAWFYHRWLLGKGGGGEVGGERVGG